MPSMYPRQKGQVNRRENQTTTLRRPRYAASSTGGGRLADGRGLENGRHGANT